MIDELTTSILELAVQFRPHLPPHDRAQIDERNARIKELHTLLFKHSK
jgi:hypothetical protein